MNQYQAIIIGFGKAGKTLAATLAKADWKVAIIEQSNTMYGGTCINIGCIPTKTLVHDAEMQHDFAAAMQRKTDVVRFLRDKNFHNLAGLDNVDVIEGRAEFVDNHTVRVIQATGTRELRGEKIFINTGAQSTMPDIKGLSSTPGVFDSTGLLNLAQRPQRLGILGGGYIGVEFASMFANFGSKVTIFEAAPLFLPREDRDVADAIARILRDKGVELILNANVHSVSSQDGAVQIQMPEETHSVDALLIASGRKPATEALQLKNAGVDVNDRGGIIVNRYLRTSADNIWAMGDVTGGLQFTYISLDDFRIVRDSLLGDGLRNTGDRQNVPYSVFMTPPLSRVGMSEEQARASGAEVQVVTLPVTAIPRARVMDDTRGMLKAVVDVNTQRILGVSLLCVDSHEMINIVKTVMDAGLPYTVLRDQIFTHPSMSESLNDLFALVK
ncbi:MULTISPECIES: reactive chlorine resistance oxidoreductase RclA [Citrobacter freundii complex]|jgi:pyruvate/2-oxoglutarate dehydrogenase complex dihydrolipoamide dehydrogenase (E3) component|uniref:Pyridine nucleotide-disulfide oxidoreductase n=1 Tax=Citrobacter gillenii TaxID=67828 RepID=A0ABD6M8N4_9ENTR|nr:MULTISPECIES: reactive chlorine resistance oxidoreductase RclA [Citrobacter freundii complex]NTZ49736.1 pyridine nucleotide-disulfide oxidoreductase [Citrobacter gillenii]QCA19454.1 pyridine nucleotide-disulfide oxidoreductase [Citrobacter freundii]QLR74014.1 pyridine nucleotide-disulfide oxidoreductase [Citrobacter freundii]QLY53279.1 pyridine nucleotide-disulfide oxidoreductase [Citrobacter freundii]